MEIFRRPPDPEAVQFADLLDAALAHKGAEQPAAADERTQQLLQVAVGARDALQVAPARPARDAARRAMLNHAANRATGASGPFQVPGFATAGALSAAVMLASLFGTVNAAEAALPGDLLYPLKGALEDTLIALTPSEAARLQLKIDFASRRVAELEALNEQERVIPAGLLERTAEQIQDVVTASKALPADAPQKRQVSSVGRKSLEVLTDVSERVPEPAKQGLQNAIAASQQAEAAAPPPPPSAAPAPVVRSDIPRPGVTVTPTVSPTATSISLLPARSGPDRRAADRSGAAGNGRGSDDDNQRGRPAPTATPRTDDRDDRNNGRGGRDDDDRGRQPTAVPGRTEPDQDGGRNPGPSRPPVAGEPTQTGGRPGPTAGPPAAGPVTPPVATPASAEPRRTRPGDDDDDDRRRPAASPTPQPRNEDDRGGPGRGGGETTAMRALGRPLPRSGPPHHRHRRRPPPRRPPNRRHLRTAGRPGTSGRATTTAAAIRRTTTGRTQGVMMTGMIGIGVTVMGRTTAAVGGRNRRLRRSHHAAGRVALNGAATNRRRSC